MPIARLTATNVRTLQPISGKRTDYTDSLCPGFVLRVSPTGARVYAVRAGGQRIKIGRVERWELGHARDKAREIIEQVAADQIPEPLPDTTAPTVAWLVATSLADPSLKDSTRKEWKRLLESEIRPTIGRRRVDRLRRAEVKAWTREIGLRSGYTALHAFEVLRRAYSWGQEELDLEHNPCAHMKKPFERMQSERVLSAPELWALLRCLDRAQRHHALYADATRLLLVTGVRRAAVLGLQRGELHNLGGLDPRWVVPRERSKSGRPHVVPLSAAALEVVHRRLAAVQTEHLFPLGLWRKVERPATWTGRWRSWLRARVQRVADARRRLEGQPPTPVPRWTIHNLRHSLATHMREDLDIAPDVVSLVLGHTLPGPRASRVYDRAERLPERRRALEAWADWLAHVPGDTRVLGWRESGADAGGRTAR